MFDKEVAEGKRFEFGKNWQSFLALLDDDRILQAETSLKEMLGVEDLKDKTFLDIGSGSGLFSLAAKRLGASVRSLDYDPQSVACARELKRRYFPDDDGWVIGEGSALDAGFISSLGKFDVVYSWGVLHHTGEMWKALDNAQLPVKENGTLYIAIYDDEGLKSKIWLKIKQLYCSGILGRIIVVPSCFTFFVLKKLLIDLAKFRNPIRRYAEYKKNRGMSVIPDWIDWVGGLPYEFAKPADIVNYYTAKDLLLYRLKIDRVVNKGMNEFIFRRCSS